MAMTNQKAPLAKGLPHPLSIEELELGLRTLRDGETDLNAFWDAHVAAFRQTVLHSVLETSQALLSPTIPLRWRIELDSQLEDLIGYLALADRYMARRPPGRRPQDVPALLRRH